MQVQRQIAQAFGVRLDQRRERALPQHVDRGERQARGLLDDGVDEARAQLHADSHALVHEQLVQHRHEQRAHEQPQQIRCDELGREVLAADVFDHVVHAKRAEEERRGRQERAHGLRQEGVAHEADHEPPERERLAGGGLLDQVLLDQLAHFGATVVVGDERRVVDEKRALAAAAEQRADPPVRQLGDPADAVLGRDDVAVLVVLARARRRKHAHGQDEEVERVLQEEQKLPCVVLDARAQDRAQLDRAREDAREVERDKGRRCGQAATELHDRQDDAHAPAEDADRRRYELVQRAARGRKQ
eukprot:Unigene8488_Nuclearia_a/m.25987 Unigene8488_Nuclearia_a/g.25987  ORF Unigene8488_Nuclearia_a/g.25987 Unigene8488_Nuclearia_a/m.25987 type:complete len:302 (+) Unigene8488_Nuclearia_a:2373-3278(+)